MTDKLLDPKWSSGDYDTTETNACEHCGMDYAVLFNADEPSSFCPFCGEFLDADAEEDDEDDAPADLLGDDGC